ncbi:Uncharacterised protein [Vibrio anguillarum]|nr:Uncharacterised protein [Vibrio anguillarum]
MGKLVEGVWPMFGMTPKAALGILYAKTQDSDTGSTASQMHDFNQNRAVIICMSLWHALGLTVH